MLFPRIEPVGSASAAGSNGRIGAKSLFSSSGGFEAQAANVSVATKMKNARFISSIHYKFWFKNRSMPSAAEMALEFTS